MALRRRSREPHAADIETAIALQRMRQTLEMEIEVLLGSIPTEQQSSVRIELLNVITDEIKYATLMYPGFPKQPDTVEPAKQKKSNFPRIGSERKLGP
jgi:hypothetical protein